MDQGPRVDLDLVLLISDALSQHLVRVLLMEGLVVSQVVLLLQDHTLNQDQIDSGLGLDLRIPRRDLGGVGHV